MLDKESQNEGDICPRMPDQTKPEQSEKIMSPNTRVVRSSCRGCHGVCQVLVHMEGEKIVQVSGDPDSPTSRGFLCPKGAAAPEMLCHPDRLKFPLRRAG